MPCHALGTLLLLLKPASCFPLGLELACACRLHKQMDTFADNLWFTKAELAAAHDTFTFSEYPHYESATHHFAKALRERHAHANDLAALVVDLHKDSRLCVPLPSDGSHAEPVIVCTMGLRDQTELTVGHLATKPDVAPIAVCGACQSQLTAWLSPIHWSHSESSG